MVVGMIVVMCELKGDWDGWECNYDVEYGYDEDFIECYVKLFFIFWIVICFDCFWLLLFYLLISVSIRFVLVFLVVKSVKFCVMDDGYGVNMIVDDL